MKLKFGNFEVGGVKINFAYETKNIWVSVASMSDFIAGGPNMGVSAGFMVADAQRRKPEITQSMAVKLPVITPLGEPSKEHQWYYRIDIDLEVFGLHPDKAVLVTREIHEPLQEGLRDELEQ